jgi:iron complex transport system substrate-binding protein
MSRLWFSLILVALALLFGLSAVLTWDAAVPVTLLARPAGTAHVEGQTFPRTLVDSYGYRFTLAGPPVRIVSAMLASDEILLDLVSPTRLLAVTKYATDPSNSNCVERARGIPPISGLTVENLLALQPDLILVSRYAAGPVVAQLRQCGQPVFCFGKFDTLQDIRDNVRLVGAAVGEDQRATQIVAWMDRVLEEVRDRTAGVATRPRVLYYYASFTFGKDTIFDELVQIAGGVNVAAEANIIGPRAISTELIPALKPDVVIVPVTEGKSDATSELLKDPVWQSLKSAHALKVVGLPQQHLTSISHHVVKAAAELAHALHPDRVPALLPVAAQEMSNHE